ncbi:PREDICTED: B3 domain-containing protein REM9-like [Ipomoea nil]|uniref:B3 domain-containing protein REM9-like n=1 Tax=Ipomoea nil TaxID=35883 RepID=UPI00090108B2|nr:PREDICTED: B3 domain-containing protein REM9-like [Ipomoea nil]
MKVNPHGYPSFLKTYLGEARYWERIQIPSKFVDTHKNKLGGSTWVLRTEDGTSWSMEIIREGTECFFGRADWEKFAKHHDLRFGDQIMAFLVGNSVFEVMVYSQTTCCRVLYPNPHPTANEEASRNAKKQKRKYVFRNKSKGSSDMKEEIFDIKNVKQEEGLQTKRYSTVNLKAKCPYFETIVKKSHQTFMCVPVDFARETGIINQKRIVLRGENGRRETVQIGHLCNRVNLIKGWKSFKKANKIRSGDKCSFTLVNPDSLFVKKLRH